jgi:hypothetical protein
MLIFTFDLKKENDLIFKNVLRTFKIWDHAKH